MKKQILDVPFEDSFEDFLEQREKIIWEESPSTERLFYAGNPFQNSEGYENHIFWTFTIFGTVLFFLFSTLPVTLIFFSLMIFLMKIFPWWQYRMRRRTRYAITPNRILFQFKKRWKGKPEFYSIHFSEIKNIIVTFKYDVDRLRKDYDDFEMEFPEEMYSDKMRKMGTIYLVPRHPELIPFETRDLENNTKRHQPTLELLENVKAVAQLIREGIQKN